MHKGLMGAPQGGRGHGEWMKARRKEKQGRNRREPPKRPISCRLGSERGGPSEETSFESANV